MPVDELSNGPDRRAVWRRGPVAATLVALALAGAFLATRSTGEPPAQAGPSPTAASPSAAAPSSTPRHAPAPTRAPLTERDLLAAPDLVVGDLRATDARHAAALLRGTARDGTELIGVRLTTDGWHSAVTLLLDAWARLIPLPDGSVAFLPFGRGRGVLHPDGAVSPLHVSAKPVRGDPGRLMMPTPPESPAGAGVSALDLATSTLHPLRGAPTGVQGFAAAPDGTTYVVTDQRTEGPTLRLRYRVRVWATTDSGRTWMLRGGIDTRSPNPMLGYVAAGPGGRVALLVSGGGATLTPFVSLWTSTDGGRSFVRQRPRHHPDTVAGMGYTADGRLLMGTESGPMWRATAASHVELIPPTHLPRGGELWGTGGLLVTRAAATVVVVSVDGLAWTAVDPIALKTRPWAPPRHRRTPPPR